MSSSQHIYIYIYPKDYNVPSRLYINIYINYDNKGKISSNEAINFSILFTYWMLVCVLMPQTFSGDSKADGVTGPSLQSVSVIVSV